jgi:hypothetical protein
MEPFHIIQIRTSATFPEDEVSAAEQQNSDSGTKVVINRRSSSELVHQVVLRMVDDGNSQLVFWPPLHGHHRDVARKI